MEVIIADNPAFCYGVERAYNLAKEQSGSRIFTWGPLIHNPQIVAELTALGIQRIDSLEDLHNGDTVIIRAHGISDKTKQKLENKEITVLDGTCPFVTKAHLIADNFVKQGLHLVIIGDKEHPEIRGIYEDFPEAIVIKNLNDVAALNFELSSKKNLGIICQTTIKARDVERILDQIKTKNPNITFENTICNATHAKQSAAEDLAKKVDCMLIIGGKNSNNTKMLHEVCQKHCTSYLISDIEEIRSGWFDYCEKVGITGGASTPLWLIEKLKNRLIDL